MEKKFKTVIIGLDLIIRSVIATEQKYRFGFHYEIQTSPGVTVGGSWLGSINGIHYKSQKSALIDLAKIIKNKKKSIRASILDKESYLNDVLRSERKRILKKKASR